MEKKVIILLADGFEEIEAITCIDLLRRAELKITVASLGNLEVKGSHQIKIKADKALKENNFNYAACVLPGGMPGAKNIAASEKAKKLINKINTEKRIIAAICASPAIVLAPMGLLDNKKATCYPGMQEYFSKSTIYQNKKVVVDKNIITGQGPAAAFIFALKIIEKLSGKERSEKIKKDCLFKD